MMIINMGGGRTAFRILSLENLTVAEETALMSWSSSLGEEERENDIYLWLDDKLKCQI